MDFNMKLKRFRVMNFRSVNDSTLIPCKDITTLVGVNESGKTNILLALWKLNPVKNGEIDPSHDLPASRVSELRKKYEGMFFIFAIFELGESADYVNERLGSDFSSNSELCVCRNYRGEYHFIFLNTKDQKKQKDLLGVKRIVNRNGEKKIIGVSEENFFNILKSCLPRFVYYSSYSNLEAKIYLPDAIRLLKGKDISGSYSNEDRARTMRILFDYIRVSPEELYRMGRNAADLARENSGSDTPNADEIKQAELEKEKRTLLLSDAGRRLTQEFNKRWNQGKYTFRFYPDGDYIFIGVADDKRPEEINLAQRSSGLQSFLSFYLIFLMECQKENKNTILLLDEMGLTLHPLAQRDLAAFFSTLAENNQIINTTHSPFIIDPERIDRCRVVYSDASGGTVVSDNLREGAGENGWKSIYAIHAALGLTVSDLLFHGCQPVVVEGVSDQIVLLSIKRFLIRIRKCPEQKETVFVPAGGTRNIPSVATLLNAVNDDLPMVLLDSDVAGNDCGKDLGGGLYKNNKKYLVSVKEFTGIDQSEIEDLIPVEFIKANINSILDVPDNLILEPEADKPIIPQIKEYADKHNIKFGSSLKIALAKKFGEEIARDQEIVPEKHIKMWISLLKKLSA